MAWEGLFVAGTFDGFALDFLGGAKVDDFPLDLVEVVLIYAKTLHYHGCFVLGCLTKLPGDDSEGHTIVFKHVQDTVEDSLVEQVPYQLESESLHSTLLELSSSLSRSLSALSFSMYSNKGVSLFPAHMIAL